MITRLPLDLRLTPSNVGVVTAPLFNEQFDRVVGDALTNVSNINIQTQNGIHDFFYIRGFDSLSSGLVLTDGASEPEATFYQLYNVERVEVFERPRRIPLRPKPARRGGQPGAQNSQRRRTFSTFASPRDRSTTTKESFDWNTGSVDNALSFRVNGLFRDQGSHREGKGGQTGANQSRADVALR